MLRAARCSWYRREYGKEAPKPWIIQHGIEIVSTDRTKGIGGSDAAAILGLSPWRSPHDVWLEKTGRAEPQRETERMRWGTLLEDAVAREYAERTGARISRSRKTLRHPQHAFLVAHIDRWSVRDGRRGILEVKTTARKSDQWGTPGTDGIPPYYAAQVLHYLGVTGAPWSDVAVLFLDRMEMEVYRVPRDEEAIRLIRETEIAFWRDHVETDTPPPPSPSEDLARRWPRETPGKTVEADAEMREIFEDLLVIRREIARLEAAEQDLRKRIELVMGDAEALTIDGRPVATWKAVSSERFETKRFRQDHPELAASYLKRIEIRRFTIKETNA